VRRSRTQIRNPDIIRAASAALIFEVFAALTLIRWVPDRRAAFAALVRNDGQKV
jgi:hypothetical protein